MTVDDDNDISGLRLIGAAVADARETMGRAAVPGITTAALDEIGERVLRRHGARSAPQLAYGFPGVTCISVNDELAHGVPSPSKRLSAGDIVNIDVSAELNGYWADTGASFAVDQISEDDQILLQATRTALTEAMEGTRAGALRRDVGRVVERRAEAEGFFVIEELAGHGVGRHIHEEPEVPNVYVATDRYRFREGQVLTIEPFFTVNPTFVVEDEDGWTLSTADGCRGAQFEHTIILTRGRPIVVTDWA